MDGEVCGQKHSQAAQTEGHHVRSHQRSLIPLLDSEFLPEDIPRKPWS